MNGLRPFERTVAWGTNNRNNAPGSKTITTVNNEDKSLQERSDTLLCKTDTFTQAMQSKNRLFNGKDILNENQQQKRLFS